MDLEVDFLFSQTLHWRLTIKKFHKYQMDSRYIFLSLCSVSSVKAESSFLKRKIIILYYSVEKCQQMNQQ